MFELKRLSEDAIPAALEKALRYRLLNEPAEAESICHDVLEIDPENQEALILLLLALTDRFGKGYAVGVIQAQKFYPASTVIMSGPIMRESSVNAEPKLNCGKAIRVRAITPMNFCADAMRWFEKAEELRPPRNDDALLHWNTCARIIMGNQLTPRLEERVELPLE